MPPSQGLVTAGGLFTSDSLIEKRPADVLHDVALAPLQDLPQAPHHRRGHDLGAGSGLEEGLAQVPDDHVLLLAAGQLRRHHVVGHVLERAANLATNLLSQGGPLSTMDSVLVSHPAAPGSNLGSGVVFYKRAIASQPLELG